ncbi:hypothetical protein LITTLEE_71 [Mycobacterium phage LittleE]|uniref:Uncharacterized protein n=2 Tax=Omegavirus TaxID=1623292 RepID=Q854J0_BPMOM|nr:gp74 [Mycobacterium phage Omega]YP_009636982.1 hypothetical protein FGG27_gp071 [Mycobacterium phage LittleE]AAN12718.1 hypothetical protein PBI_OMEGA_74 [Mycobacterium phage Omega]AEK09454.1 hypothetical protein LITTLEE_71 [Mycobacterium phage LittleE]
MQGVQPCLGPCLREREFMNIFNYFREWYLIWCHLRELGPEGRSLLSGRTVSVAAEFHLDGPEEAEEFVGSLREWFTACEWRGAIKELK